MYSNYNSSHKLISLQGWFDLELLIPELRAIQNINYSIVSQRQNALERLNKIPNGSPWSQDKRFPSESLYVCQSLGDWGRKFVQLRTSLAFKERDLRQKQDFNSDRTAENDSLLSFYNVMNDLLTALEKFENIFDREKFEKYYKLQWNEKSTIPIGKMESMERDKPVSIL